MTINKTTTDLSTLKINYLTKEMYEDALENDEINENELYITPGSGSGAYIVTFTYDNVEDEWSCDKTAQEIYEACMSGTNVVGVHYYGDPITSKIFYVCDTVDSEVEDSITSYFAEFGYVNSSYGSIVSERLYVSNSGVRSNYNYIEPVPKQRTINNIDLSADITLTASDVGAQEPLVSGTNIKTINNNSILGSGNLNISVPTKTSDLTNDSGFISTETDPTVPSWAKQNTKPTYTASEVGALPDTTTIPSKTSDLTNDSGFITGMTILSYGNSTWQNFIDAYNANKVVYCRASSNSNPASGSQTRLAFMAYVNNATTPTEVEFQYYRSVSTHTASQQGDQVYVYKLNKTNGWTVTIREASVKVVAGTGLGGTYSNGTMT